MQSRSKSIKVLDHAMSGAAGTEACETFVEAQGLKYLFSTFMGKVGGHAIVYAWGLMRVFHIVARQEAENSRDLSVGRHITYTWNHVFLVFQSRIRLSCSRSATCEICRKQL